MRDRTMCIPCSRVVLFGVASLRPVSPPARRQARRLPLPPDPPAGEAPGSASAAFAHYPPIAALLAVQCCSSAVAHHRLAVPQSIALLSQMVLSLGHGVPVLFATGRILCLVARFVPRRHVCTHMQVCSATVRRPSVHGCNFTSMHTRPTAYPRVHTHTRTPHKIAGCSGNHNVCLVTQPSPPPPHPASESQV
jgi:hypothetical protein